MARRGGGGGGGNGGGGGFVTRAPSNGTLAAVFTCAGRMAEAIGTRQGRLRARGAGAGTRGASAGVSGGGEKGWGLLVMGDSPGFISLARRLPQLQGRTIDTADSGNLGHTAFGTSCSSASGRSGRPGSCVAPTSDPGGAWTRSMLDLYLAGVTDGFVSALFSSFVGAVTARSLTCCKERKHFGAMYSQTYSHRDVPMRNEQVLQVLMQTTEEHTAVEEWGTAL